jgi:maleate isomerase
MTDNEALAAIVADLLDATSASRTTVRLTRKDGQPELVAEALAPGVVSMATQTTPGIAEAPTYRYLEEHQTLLIQNDCQTDPVEPPRSLIDVFHVHAQMLAPVVIDGALVATISVHDERARAWSDVDVASLEAAQSAVTKTLVDLGDV